MPRSDKESSSPGLKPYHWFILSAAVPLVHCASRLDLDLWHDEIYTADHFVSRGPLFIVTDYSAPNNHVLYSLVLWPFYLLSDVNFVLRLPSFLFTIGTLAIVFSIALRQNGLPGAVLSTSLLGLNQMFLVHTIQVRGYGISMFLTAWLCWLVLADEARSWRQWFTIAGVGAAFLYVMPTNLLFFAPLAVASVLIRLMRHDGDFQLKQTPHTSGRHRETNASRSPWPANNARVRRKRAVVDASAWFVGTLAALACYLPIAAQVRAAAKASSPSSWSSLPPVVVNFLWPAMHDYFWFAPLILASAVVLVWPPDDGARRRWILPMLGLGAAAGSFLLTAMLRISPFERNYCPLLVLLALSSGWLLAELVQFILGRLPRAVSLDAATAAALGLTAIILCPQLWTYPQRLKERREQREPTNPWIADGYYCYYAADYHPSAVVRYLADIDFDRSPFSVSYVKADFLNLWWCFYHSRLSGVEPAYGEIDIYAIVPEPAPWKALAEQNQFSEQEVREFRLIADFGYYRLYRSAGRVDVGDPPAVKHTKQRTKKRS